MRRPCAYGARLSDLSGESAPQCKMLSWDPCSLEKITMPIERTNKSTGASTVIISMIWHRCGCCGFHRLKCWDTRG